jgi:two-component system osmolarity sensor histidine kinase EnvZ
MVLIGDIGARMGFPARVLRRLARSLRGLLPAITARLPKGLYTRSILIVVLPILILQAVVAYVFMERHWQMVTRRLSTAVTRDIAAVIEVIETYPQDERFSQINRIAAETFGLTVSVLPPGPLPAPGPRPFFSLLDSELSRGIENEIQRPYWIDTVGDSDMVEIRIDLVDHVLRVFAPRSRAYASNSHIFLLWMAGTSLVLIAIALLFLRNQIKPILTLARAAERFGKGRPVSDFRPRGAREVRQAALAFIEMRDRIERHVEQRTVMLAGVSHDLRTVLTRFKLQLALFEETPELEAMRADVDEMQAMLEDYMAFAKGDSGEEIVRADIGEILGEVKAQAHGGKDIAVEVKEAPLVVPVRRHAFKRAIANLVNNAARFAEHVNVSAAKHNGALTVEVEDDGPGIPEAEREQVFRPFYRLDHARNQDSGSTGLGLAIARDIARIHGGDIKLSRSPLGGLKAVLKVPV